MVVAPAGTGKTALLSDWSQEETTPVAWVSVNPSADAREFWRGVGSALDHMHPGCADRTAADLDSASALEPTVTRLLDGLHAVPSDGSVLLVDDVHLVDETDELAASIQQFVQQLPDWLHVVLSSRREPRLPLDRLRARGEVVELRFRELLLSPDEAGEMLSREHLALPKAQIESVIARADGWAAALELAVPAARTTDAQERVDDFDAEYERLLRNYVLHEVLGEESAEDLAVLGELSIVDRISPGLADALLDRTDAERWLLRAEARSLVTGVVPAGWYEVHSLVRTVLNGEVASRFPDQLEPLHRRAARWYERAGDVPATLEHLLLGGRPARRCGCWPRSTPTCMTTATRRPFEGRSPPSRRVWPWATSRRSSSSPGASCERAARPSPRWSTTCNGG